MHTCTIRDARKRHAIGYKPRLADCSIPLLPIQHDVTDSQKHSIIIKPIQFLAALLFQVVNIERKFRIPLHSCIQVLVAKKVDPGVR